MGKILSRYILREVVVASVVVTAVLLVILLANQRTRQNVPADRCRLTVDPPQARIASLTATERGPWRTGFCGGARIVALAS